MGNNFCKVGDNALNIRKVPIVFVPGVMGSRLWFPDKDFKWDTDDKVNMVRWAAMTSEDARTTLDWAEVKGKVLTENEKIADKQVLRGWGGVSYEFYAEKFLPDLDSHNKQSALMPVYAVGYDWRQSNRVSGIYLGHQIENILKKEKGAEQYILISHSMGGLVTRAFLANPACGGMAKKCLGVIHVAQPALGAAVFYSRMYTGTKGNWSIKGYVLKHIIGTTARDFATLLSALRGPCELMPNNQYTDVGKKDWLWVKSEIMGNKFWSSYGGEVYNAYRSASAPPSILWSLKPAYDYDFDAAAEPEALIDMRSRINQAEAFHAWLGSYKHSNTWAIYGVGLSTDMAVRFPFGFFSQKTSVDHVEVRSPLQGDGTVPCTSASALFSPAETSNDETGAIFTRDLTKRQCEVNGLEHGDLMNQKTVQTIIKQMLKAALGQSNPQAAEVGPMTDGGSSYVPGTEDANVSMQPADSDWSGGE